ncbi:MAG: COX15/CtaA family protein [Polyangiales bacterium]
MASPSAPLDPTSAPMQNAAIDAAARAGSSSAKAIARWLFVCALFVAAMVAVGGYTRLSHAGLSITEWKPVTGALPPLSHEAWLGEYAKYRNSPEFRLLHHWMSLEDFKGIYWIEWTHRLLGRVTGLVVLLPLLFFVKRRALTGRRLGAVLGVFALGGLQGFLGWFMVASGLVRDPNVSHFRLTAHLLMALLIFVALIVLGLRISDEASDVPARDALPRVRTMAFVSLASAFVTITWGGLVAGLKAGLVCDTFPLMHGSVVPSGMFTLTPAIANLFNHGLAVQFVHRTLAYTTASIVIATAVVTLRTPSVTAPVKRAAWMLVAAVALQITLGALTVLTHVHKHTALTHQCNALFIIVSALVLAHRAKAHPRVL